MERWDLDSTYRRIQDDARVRLPRKDKGSNLHIQREVLRSGQQIDARDREIKIERDTVVVFADDAPLFNWAHPCRYVLYDAKEGTPYREVPANFPPFLVDPPETFVAFHEPVVFARPEVLWPGLWFPRIPLRPMGGDWFAVLFSGASNNRHTNDLEFLYRTLVNDHGVAPDHIYVLNYDGTINYSGGPHPVTNWPGDNTPYQMTVNGQGTKSELEGVFDELKTRLGKTDKLMIHTNNHGGHNGESYLCTYSGADYGAADFATKLGELPEFSCLMVMMEQCHSGGFNGGVISNSTASQGSIASACIEPNSSIGGPEFDPFARDWIAAMHDSDPDGDALDHDPDMDSNGWVSAEEGFDYADSVHDPYDTPIYDESSAAGGECAFAKTGPKFRLPEIPVLVRKQLGKWPIPEALEIVEKAMPELERTYAQFVPRFMELQEDLEREIAGVLNADERARQSGEAKDRT